MRAIHAVLVLALLLSSCLEVKGILLRFDLKAGTGEITYVDIRSSEAADVQEDFASLLTEHLHGKELEEDRPRLFAISRELHEVDGELHGTVRFRFSDPAAAGIYQHDKRSPWIYCIEGSSKIARTNGTDISDVLDGCVAWDRKQTVLEVELAGTERSATTAPLLATWTAWVAEGSPPPTPKTPDGASIELPLPPGAVAAARPRFSPDGTQVAVEVKASGGETEVWTLAWDGQRATGAPEKVVPQTMSTARYNGHPRGSAFAWNPRWGASMPWSMVRTGADGEALLVDGWSRAFEARRVGAADWDPTTDRLIVPMLVEKSMDLYLWDPENASVPMQMTFPEDRVELDPAFSPDGARVAYVERGGAAAAGLRLLDVQTYADSWIYTVKEGTPRLSSWSPDGAKIAFFVTAGDGSDLRWVESRPGGKFGKLLDGLGAAQNSPPAWTPDGKQIVVVLPAVGGPDQLCAIAVDGSGRRCVEAGYDAHDPELMGKDIASAVVAYVARRSPESSPAVFVAPLPR